MSKLPSLQNLNHDDNDDIDWTQYGLKVVRNARSGQRAVLPILPSQSHCPGMSVLTAEQKTSLAYGIINNDLTSKQVITVTGVDRSTVKRWVSCLKQRMAQGEDNPQLIGSSRGGAPPIMDAQANSELEARASAGQQKNKSIKVDTHFKTVELVALAQESQARRGHAPNKTTINIKTLPSIIQRAEVKTVKGRTLSAARQKAFDDPRNAITGAVAAEVMCCGRDPALLANMDATQFLGIASEDNCELLATVGNGAMECRILQPEEMAVFLKHTAMCGFNGHGFPPLYAIANANVPDNSYILEKIPLMSHSCDPSAFGWMAFTPTRGGNMPFYKKMLLCIVFPEFIRIRDSLCLDKEADDYMIKSLGAFFFDGEQLVIEALTDPEIIAEADRLNIALCKYAASMSAGHQVMDVGPIFRGEKASLKTVTVYEYQNPALERHVKLFIESKNDVLKLTACQIRKIIRVILMAVKVSKKWMTPQNIISGALKAGMIGDPRSWPIITRRALFNFSTHKWTYSEMQIINSQWQQLMEVWKHEGSLSDAILDDMGMPRAAEDDGSVFKEDRVIYRQRTVLLNHPTVMGRIIAREDAINSRLLEAAHRRHELDRIADTKPETDAILLDISSAIDEVKACKLEIDSVCAKGTKAHQEAKKQRHAYLDSISSNRDKLENM